MIENDGFYNEKLKEEWTNSFREKPQRYAASLVALKFAPYERKIGKDIGEMSVSELMTGLQEFPDASYKSSSNNIGYTRQYLEFYSKNVSPVPVEISSGLDISKFDLTEQFKTNYIKSQREFLDEQSKFAVEDGDSIIPVCILLWQGMTFSEIYPLEKKDISISGPSVRAIIRDKSGEPSEEIKFVDVEMAGILSAYMNLVNVSVMRKGVLVSKTMDTDRFFLKSFYLRVPKSRAASATYLSGFGEEFDRLFPGKRISSGKITLSGRYNRSALHEMECGELTNGYLIKEFRLGKTVSPGAQLLSARRSIETYKKAFFES